MRQIKGVLKVLLSKVIGFLIFLLILFLLNILTNYIDNNIFTSIVSFLNTNLFLIILFSLILMIGEIFGYLIFPFNLPAPIFNAVGWVLLLRFLFNIVIFSESLSGIYMQIPFNLIYLISSLAVFIIILITGYLKIFIDLSRPVKIGKIKKRQILQKS